MVKHGKRYRAAAETVDRQQRYEPAAAIGMLRQTATSKFDETVELHLRTSADPRHADQQLRGVASLPHGLGKPVRVAVFVAGERALAAQEAGAEVVGAHDHKERHAGGVHDIDVAHAPPGKKGKEGRQRGGGGRRG
ncbi:MAG: 50S ribosomal protein L1, partial [Chloroflexi bacterium]|nr:50S ribosomal protein L1 [Chloroflexota bacterium]